MPLSELTGNRPTTYSAWHRRLPQWCCLADGDWFEVRYGKVIAIVETIQVWADELGAAGQWIIHDPWQQCWYPERDLRYPLWPTKKIVLNYLLGVTKLSIYVVYHTPDMARVRLLDLRRKTLRDFDEKGFAQWLEMLS